MALDYRKNYHNDDFYYMIGKNNPDPNDGYPTGKTGYE
jgi:hypothetical protein